MVDNSSSKEKSKEEKVKKFKSNIEEWFKYFDENIKKYKFLMNFAYNSTLSDQDKENLAILNRPDIELNYTSAYLSKFLGELSTQTPEVSVRGNGSSNDISMLTRQVVEKHMQDIFMRYEKTCKNTVLKQQCGGSYSVFKVTFDYDDPLKFDPLISIKKTDPTLCFFSPMAKDVTKSDSTYWGELIPMYEKEAIEKYPKIKSYVESMGFNERGSGDFSWSYMNGTKKVVVLADYYCVKKGEKKNLVRLSNNRTMLQEEYEEFINSWDNLEPPPEIVQTRKTEINTVKRYVICGDKIIQEESTPYPFCNYFFVPGDNSDDVYRSENSTEKCQKLKSYCSDAVGAQRMLNYTAQTCANFQESIMQQKYMLEYRSVRDVESWVNPQRASLLLYSSESEDKTPLPKPEPIMQQDLPASITSTFFQMPQLIQNTMGYSDPRLNAGEASGEAMYSANVENSTAGDPFRKNYIDSLNYCADFILKLLPKVYVTPMTIPIVIEDGNRFFVPVNQQNEEGAGVFFDYSADDLGVVVKGSTSFALQKDRALRTVTQLMGSSELFNQFMNQYGLEYIIDNLDIKGKDQLAKDAKKFTEEQKEARQSQGQPDPRLIQQQQEYDIKLKQVQLEQEQMRIKEAELQLKNKDIEIKRDIERLKLAESRTRAGAELQNSAIDAHVKVSDQMLKHEDQLHKHTIDVMKVHR